MNALPPEKNKRKKNPNRVFEHYQRNQTYKPQVQELQKLRLSLNFFPPPQCHHSI